MESEIRNQIFWIVLSSSFCKIVSLQIQTIKKIENR